MKQSVCYQVGGGNVPKQLAWHAKLHYHNSGACASCAVRGPAMSISKIARLWDWTGTCRINLTYRGVEQPGSSQGS